LLPAVVELVELVCERLAEFELFAARAEPNPTIGAERRVIADDFLERLAKRRRAADQAAEETEALHTGFLPCEEREVLDPQGSWSIREEASDARRRDQHLGVGASPHGYPGSHQEPVDGRADTLEDGHDRGDDARSGEPYGEHGARRSHKPSCSL